MDSFYGSTVTKAKYPANTALSILSSAYATMPTYQPELPYASLYNVRAVPSAGVGCSLPGQSTALAISGTRDPARGTISLSTSGVPTTGTQYQVIYVDYIPDPNGAQITLSPYTFSAGCTAPLYHIRRLPVFTNVPKVRASQGLQVGLPRRIVAFVLDTTTGTLYRSDELLLSTTNF